MELAGGVGGVGGVGGGVFAVGVLVEVFVTGVSLGLGSVMGAGLKVGARSRTLLMILACNSLVACCSAGLILLDSPSVVVTDGELEGEGPFS